ncbi:MAG: N-acetylneuraminate synthase family protein [Candidatus Niyogibacteria bacterium]|nr:N-acetylneuraminate synthase family protein [Candidatus Niyogibacteria bacterium]
MANNHQGSIKHGLRIIREMAKVAKVAGVRAAIKLQFRDLDSFIHPKHKECSDNKHIPRFLATRLSEEEFGALVNEIKRQRLISMATPFDELSVDMAERLGVEILKIGSCSATDWPLLERVVKAGKPVICSTGGLNVSQIDRIVSFFQHRGARFALMHCVAIYPTPVEKMRLGRIEQLCKRYPGVTVGFSTHEDPNNFNVVQIAYAKGARIFEKHVAVPTKAFKSNAYSANPKQAAKWLAALNDAMSMCGNEEDLAESLSLNSLMRGVYAKKNITIGSKLSRENVYFAIPLLNRQLASGEWNANMVAGRAYAVDEAIFFEAASYYAAEFKHLIPNFIHQLKGIIHEAGVPVGPTPEIELSHHYGLKHFLEWGVAIIDCINREYCKKILIMLAGQKHPIHFHTKKEEAFQVLYGELIVEMEDRERILYPGDVLMVPRGAWHSFYACNGDVIFEEISTTHYNDDSFYADPSINKIARDERKTRLVNWGRHQI